MSMRINTLASGSSGNAYTVSDGETTLLLEAGLPAYKLCTMTDLSKIDACFITHEHGDHAKGAADLSNRYGLPVIGTKGTMQTLRLSSIYAEPIKVGEEVRVKSFIIKAFSVPHDATEPVGYIIYSTATREKLLFLTDCYYIPIKMPLHLTHLVVECNYSLKLLSDGIENGETAHEQRDRIRRSHMSLETLSDWLIANEERLKSVREIHLIHISKRNGNAEFFKNEIRRLTGKAVY